ncbi:amidase [Microbacterium sp. SLBN-154]|uniref:amidase n=1 Tax=Microbacterium sp. SLBN-154 TaxID=2768458 RepID=UPI001151C781|nr:amidase [Microbacterium sp. SLBN-154]TQK19128.1 amidase [Microbacterium sp. SLBN-154]
MSDLLGMSAVDLAAALRRRELGAVEVVRAALARAAATRELGAFVEVTAERALEQAARRDAAVPDGPLWGIPIADKDLVARAGVPTRYGSRTRADFVPTASDPLAAALDRADAVSIGKTSTSEFGLTGYTEPLGGGAWARDPWNPAHGAGGSSGGAAVAVAAGVLAIAPGSDGGGSIRIPAATVGVVGLKPSRGRLPLGSGLDAPDGLAVTGPIARTVEDAAFFLDALCALAPYDFSVRAADSPPFLPATAADPPRLRVGVTTVSPWDDDLEIAVDPAAIAALDEAARSLASEGHVVEDAAWRPHGYGPLFRVLWRASAARIPLTDDDLRMVEPLTAWLVREGRALDARGLLGALAEARVFERETIAAFAPYDVVLTPALAQTPRPIGWYDRDDPERGFAQQVEYAPFSSFVNVAGLPALVLPLVMAAGHPVSVQLIGRPGGERTILAAAAQLERLRGPLPRPPAP